MIDPPPGGGQGGVGGADEGSSSELTPDLYRELRGAARRQLRRMRPGQTLNTTALVHEAYLKVADRDDGTFTDRAHFVAVAAVAMRHILVDYARRRAAKKHGGDVLQVSLDGREVGERDRSVELLVVDEALESLSARSPRLGRLVELRYFGGLSVAETADVLGMSDRTVKRDWRKARAVLFQMLGDSAA